MTNEERVRLHGIRKHVQAALDYGHFPCLTRWDTQFLLELAARCDVAEREVVRAVLRDRLRAEGER